MIYQIYKFLTLKISTTSNQRLKKALILILLDTTYFITIIQKRLIYRLNDITIKAFISSFVFYLLQHAVVAVESTSATKQLITETLPKIVLTFYFFK